MTKKQRRDLLRAAALEASLRGGKASEKTIADRLEEAGLNRPLAERMAREAREIAARDGALPIPQPPRQEDSPVYPGDLDALRGKVLERPEGGQSRALLCAMFLCLRARPHPSGRIRYEDAGLMACAGIGDARSFRAAFASLADAGLVKVAVVGSRNPTETLSLPWAPKPEGEPTETIPFAKNEGKRLAERLAKEGI